MNFTKDERNQIEKHFHTLSKEQMLQITLKLVEDWKQLHNLVSQQRGDANGSADVN